MNSSSVNAGKQTVANMQASSVGRELLADNPSDNDQKIASFITLFERKSAVTLWQKIKHTLLMPFRRYWARQHVAKVLECADKYDSIKTLTEVRRLREAFNQGGRIEEKVAHRAAMKMMLKGVMPDKQWRKALDDHVKKLEEYCMQLQSSDGPLFPNLLEDSPELRGLRALMDFARNPGCAVSNTEEKDVWAFTKKVMGINWDNQNPDAVQMYDDFQSIKLYYNDALKNPGRVVET